MIYRRINAIRKQIASKQTILLIECIIGIEKSSNLWIIIPALQRIQSALRIIAITAVPMWILLAQRTSQGPGCSQRFSPGIVGILDNYLTARVVQPNDIPLPIIQVVVLRTVQVHGQQRAVGVVAVVDGVRAVRLVRDPAVGVGIGRGRAVYGLRDAVAVSVVSEGQRAAGFGHAHQLAALRPGIRPLAVRQQVVLAISVK